MGSGNSERSEIKDRPPPSPSRDCRGVYGKNNCSRYYRCEPSDACCCRTLPPRLVGYFSFLFSKSERRTALTLSQAGAR